VSSAGLVVLLERRGGRLMMAGVGPPSYNREARSCRRIHPPTRRFAESEKFPVWLALQQERSSGRLAALRGEEKSLALSAFFGAGLNLCLSGLSVVENSLRPPGGGYAAER